MMKQTTFTAIDPMVKTALMNSNLITTVHPAVSSESLLKGQQLVHITHNGEVYQLRTTRLGKLILTK